MRLHHLHLRRPERDLHRCHQIVWETVGGRALWSQPDARSRLGLDGESDA